MTQNILIVEDKKSTADTICYALETEYFTTNWKTLGNDGIEYIKRNNIDLAMCLH